MQAANLPAGPCTRHIKTLLPSIPRPSEIKPKPQELKRNMYVGGREAPCEFDHACVRSSSGPTHHSLQKPSPLVALFSDVCVN